MRAVVGNYPPEDVHIGVIGSHSALILNDPLYALHELAGSSISVIFGGQMA